MDDHPMKPPADASSIFSFEHVGFERFDWPMLSVIAQRMAIAAVLAAFVAYRPWRRLMRGQFERPESGAQVLIACAGGLIAPVVGSNTALAFALVGLGGFIRFRSGIKDPREAGVMFFMIGIGLACGVGVLPIALVATVLSVALLVILDLVEGRRRKAGRKRIRVQGAADPGALEPALHRALAKSMIVHGSKIGLKSREVSVDVSGGQIASAGAVLALMQREGITFDGEVSCDEL
jgi:hypothetical protein